MIESFDLFFLTIMHALECSFLTGLNTVITFLGEKGILFFLLSIICMLFPRTRKFGVCLFGAICCGALITNIILKDWVARERPYVWNPTYREWWLAVGSPLEDGYSFPSGHVTAAAAGCTAICMTYGKKWILPSAIWVFLMMCARTYLMVHHPTDVLAGLLIGVASGLIAYYIAELIFDQLKKRRMQKWAEFCLEYSIPIVDDVATRVIILYYDGKTRLMKLLPVSLRFSQSNKKGSISSDFSAADASPADYSSSESRFSELKGQAETLLSKVKLPAFLNKNPEEPDSPHAGKKSSSSSYQGKHER